MAKVAGMTQKAYRLWESDGEPFVMIGGMRVALDRSLPGNVIEVHHPDGRTQRFKVPAGFTLTPPAP